MFGGRFLAPKKCANAMSVDRIVDVWSCMCVLYIFIMLQMDNDDTMAN